jgi:site-specific DNA-methyltransferase (adenine-specific)
MPHQDIPNNTLFYGDNLDILKEHIGDNSIDLIYIDPPFNSNRDYNVLFKDEQGKDSESQIATFRDTWHWNEQANRTYYNIIRDAPAHVGQMIGALHSFIGPSQMMAYLVMMAARLVELHRVLKPTGSLYLHCDPTASHYLKIVLDSIFGPEHFRSEIIWRRTNSHNKTTQQYGPIHDSILFYSKGKNFTFHPGTRPYSKAYIEDRFKSHDQRGRYQLNYLTGPGTRNGESGHAWRNFNPTTVGRHWAIPSSLRPFLPNAGKGMSSLEQLEALYKQDLIVFPQKQGGQPMYKQYVGPGVPYQDIWAYQPNTRGTLFESNESIDEDVKYLEDEPERTGYDTQKPVGLLERIITTSSNPGDIVLDAFAGCGTTVAAAQKLSRRWIGIDITHLSIALLRYRLKAAFANITFDVRGEPEDLGAAQQLAQDDRYQFQWWALSLVKAKPQGGQEGSKTGKKGSDKGIDGIINFVDDHTGKLKRVLIQVKSGKVKSGDIRDLIGTVQRESAAIGIFITLEPPTKDMQTEAITANYYHSPAWPDKNYPKIQILSIADLLEGDQIKMPAEVGTFKQAQRIQQSDDNQLSLMQPD